MDHLMYVAASGATETMLAQAANSHNLANVSTTGFKADLVHAESAYLVGAGADSRVHAPVKQQGTDLRSGVLTHTGSATDVAVLGDGWISVQAPTGGEGLSRRGDLRVDEMGQLLNGAGEQVMGNNGPIALPPFSSMTIGSDGTISIVPEGEPINSVVAIDRIKLVNPPFESLEKAPNGLMQVAGGAPSEPDADVRLGSGTLESSNVNSVGSLVRMIELSRQFEQHVKMMKTAEELDQSSAGLMRIQ